ncbi:Mov34/MPN/PAD-1 family protein [Inediibacterium massiliense]|uniref:Mov34/MPN/PAD-1 family protein n=1 Tax=Inediibacterium massiliense TaxID=1658111 RepID=UPI0006B61C4C|nr:Mov34/MPN/PAD-1 family protein [Inediibacterium massiliense]
MEVLFQIKDIKIKFTEKVINTINTYKQQSNESLEAGGILIGRENVENGNTIIEYITVPLKKDLRRRYEFIRRDKGHQKYLDKIWGQGNVHIYFGEWHTHPEDYPMYSTIDLKNWIKLSNTIETKSKYYYFLIAGRREIRIWALNILDKKLKRVY